MHLAEMEALIVMHLCREAAAQNADHFRALKLLGSALYALGDFQGARQELQAALQLQPDYPDALCDLGCTFCALGQTQEAGRAFRNALAVNPDHLEVSAPHICSEHAALLLQGFARRLQPAQELAG